VAGSAWQRARRRSAGDKQTMTCMPVARGRRTGAFTRLANGRNCCAALLTAVATIDKSELYLQAATYYVRIYLLATAYVVAFAWHLVATWGAGRRHRGISHRNSYQTRRRRGGIRADSGPSDAGGWSGRRLCALRNIERHGWHAMRKRGAHAQQHSADHIPGIS